MNREYKVITVTEKATGNLVEIKDFRFNPDLYEEVEEGTIVEIEDDTETSSVQTPGSDAKFETMKMNDLRAFAKSKGMAMEATITKDELLERIKALPKD